MVDALNKTVQPIWRPHTTYAIHIQGRDKVNGSGTMQNHEILFKTAGGIGDLHEYWDGNNGYKTLDAYTQNPDSFRLANLTDYIDMPKCFPNADGRLINAKPLYYHDPELLLFFTKQYVVAMFSTWGDYQNNEELEYELVSVIKDPASDQIISTDAEWEGFDFPRLNQETQVLANMIQNGNPCAQVNQIDTFGIRPKFKLPHLKPLKTYQAIFTNKFHVDNPNFDGAKNVHEYIFETSRFKDFEEHINSYLIKDEDGNLLQEAIFTIEVSPTAAELTTAGSIFSDTMPANDPLKRDFALPYDRLLDGVLKIGAQHPPETLEFNLIQEKTSNDVIAIWIRGPEPLNDPKTPKDVLFGTATPNKAGIICKNSAHAPNDFAMLYSKDLSNAIISLKNGSMNLNSGDYRFDFNFLLFNGQTYEVKADVKKVKVTI